MPSTSSFFPQDGCLVAITMVYYLLMAGTEFFRSRKIEQGNKKEKHRIKSYRPENNHSGYTRRTTDATERKARSSDAAHFPGGYTPEVVKVLANAGEAEIAQVVRDAEKILPIGAQSSLTGGATPEGAVILDMSAHNRILHLTDTAVTAQAGLTLHELQKTLDAKNIYYPPVPTFDGATIGGVIATNAAGANTFKYGQTRQWVEGLTVVLANGEVLDIQRGDYTAHRADKKHTTGYFEIEDTKGNVQTVPVPTYTMPDVAKISAGYYAAEDMDLIDLFIGSEGTLGVITKATLKLIPKPQTAWALIPCESEKQALALTKELRHASEKAWQSQDSNGIDMSAIEYIDEQSLNLVRQAGKNVPKSAKTALIVQLEMAKEHVERAYDDLGQVFDNPDTAPDVPLVRFAKILQKHGLLENEELGLAMPGETTTIEQFRALREAVPEVVNALNGRRGVQKVAGDMIVPFDRLPAMMRTFQNTFGGSTMDYAVWGHISDGNMHPNIMPKNTNEVDKAKSLLQKAGRRVVKMGGSPLAEHGVGRNPLKQEFLLDLYGKDGIEQMRAVKKALDPTDKLAPGNIFSAH